ncbi:winged helix-turn-helix transcriptional regulator [Elizabethkingia ursingii]|uniref:winged helix-turn-helix transcriptional regulator n=1 Tax=Elizabethkingia TaxID=308865 RepID=UPI000D2FC331|nr:MULTISPECIES: winged helix-turn-helix transcriptional regulator [Elizabethkingia]MCL1666567.1 winged helix-turn-helix transcriptional regulator [Elizabethkingia ursingii]PUB26335.1 HxlR family transcriptional regulator [Elizabethkingia sp. YR214]
MSGLFKGPVERCLRTKISLLDGIFIRTAYLVVPHRVEYSLSAKGESLRQIIDLLSVWSMENVAIAEQIK